MPGFLDVFGDFLAEDILGLLVIVYECLRFALQDAIGSNMLGVFGSFWWCWKILAGKVRRSRRKWKFKRWTSWLLMISTLKIILSDTLEMPQSHRDTMTTQVKTTAICNMTVQFTMIFLQGFNVYQSTYVYIYNYILYILYIYIYPYQTWPIISCEGIIYSETSHCWNDIWSEKRKVGTVGVPIAVPAWFGGAKTWILTWVNFGCFGSTPHFRTPPYMYIYSIHCIVTLCSFIITICIINPSRSK